MDLHKTKDGLEVGNDAMMRVCSFSGLDPRYVLCYLVSFA